MAVLHLGALLGLVLPLSCRTLDDSQPPLVTTWHRQSQSVEDRLREVEATLRFRWELSTEALGRRIEALDARLTRTHAAIALKLDAIAQGVVSCELKSELAKDQLSRKLESSQERFAHRLGYLESRLDLTISKLQGTLETGLAKLTNKESDLETELSDIRATIDEIKSHSVQWDERINATQKTIAEVVQKIQTEVAKQEEVAKLSEAFHEHFNVSTSVQDQNDGPPNIPNRHAFKAVQSIKNEVVNEAHKMTTKVNNMYNDLWRRIMTLEELMRNAILATNITRRELQEEMRTFVIENREAEAHDNFVEIAVDSLANMIHKKVGELGRKLETNFQRVTSTQTLFLETCHRLQEDEPLLEAKLSLILEKILDNIVNRTARVDKQLVELFEAVKAHNSQVIRTVAHATNMVGTLAEESSHDHKHLDSIIYEAAERTEAMLQEFQEEFQEYMNSTAGSQCYIPKETGACKEAKNCKELNETFSEIKTQESDTLKNETSNQKNREEEEEDSKTHLEKVNIIEANYDKGVLKLLTERVSINTTDNYQNESIALEIPLDIINKSISVDFLTAIIHESKPKGNEKHGPNNTSVISEEKTQSTAPPYKKKDEMEPKDILELNRTTSKTEEENQQETAIHLLLLYTKVLKGHLSKAGFLEQVDPKIKMQSVQQLIQSIKGSKFIPSEFIKDLEHWDKDTELTPEIELKKPFEEYSSNYDDFYEIDTGS